MAICFSSNEFEKIWEAGVAMAVYMVDRHLPGVTKDQLVAAQRAAIETSQRFTAQGKRVRYIRSTFVPGESRCMCLFEAESPQIVREVNQTATIPFSRVIEAEDLTPEPVPK